MSSAVVESMPFADYARLPYVHATALKRILVSPRAYRYYADAEDSDSDTLRLGRAAHTAVLEPLEFLGSYVLWDGGVRRGKAWDAFVTEAGPRTILTQAQYATAKAVAKAVQSHPVASRLLTGGRPEVSVKWVHPRLGILIKCRLDYLGASVIDLKTCRDPSPAKFCTAAASLAYDMQLALYTDAAAAAGYGALPCKIIAAQNVEPFDVVVYDVPEDVLSIGREKCERALELYCECTKSGSWPGMAPSEELTLRLPAWAVPEVDEEPIMFGDQAL